MSVQRKTVSGSEAIARGLVEAGVEVVTGYPVPPASDIVPAVHAFSQAENFRTYVEWSVNEKAAFNVALAASLSGKRAAVVVGHVGLHIAAENLLSAVYTGTRGGLVIISTDDPGPLVSQTEHDSRLFAYFARTPVFDPVSPSEIMPMLKAAYQISEQYEIPVLFRVGIRMCYARETAGFSKICDSHKTARFERDPVRFAGPPRVRYMLHKMLNDKLKKIRAANEGMTSYNLHNGPASEYPIGVVTCGVTYKTVSALLKAAHLADKVPVCRISTPYPFPAGFYRDFRRRCKKVLILEEPMAVIELFVRSRIGVRGRLSGYVPEAGELTPSLIADILKKILGKEGFSVSFPDDKTELNRIAGFPKLPAAAAGVCESGSCSLIFGQLRELFPDAIFPSDLACYATADDDSSGDTLISTDAAVSLASGFGHAYGMDGKKPFIIATAGCSSFYHSGVSALAGAVSSGARFLLVILEDERVCGITELPSPCGERSGEDGNGGSMLEPMVRACGVNFVGKANPTDRKAFKKCVRRAEKHVRAADGGVAVVIARETAVS